MHPKSFNYDDKKYERFIRAKTCLVCGGESEVHHVYNVNKKNFKNSFLSVPLCPFHHRHGFPFSYHGMGKEPFETKHGVNLEWFIINYLSEYMTQLSEEIKKLKGKR